MTMSLNAFSGRDLAAKLDQENSVSRQVDCSRRGAAMSISSFSEATTTMRLRQIDLRVEA
jgi:hypothetical protein